MKTPLFTGLFKPLKTETTTKLPKVGTTLQYSFDHIDDYVYIPTITLTGDFEISLKCVKSLEGNLMTLGKFGKPNTWGFYNYSTQDRLITQFEQNNGTNLTINHYGLPALGELTEYKAVRVGDVLTLYVNGVEVNSDTAVADSIEIDLIGARAVVSNLLWAGVIKDVYFNDLTDPANSRFYPLNDGAGTTVAKDTLGGHHGEYRNFNNDRWEAVNE